MASFFFPIIFDFFFKVNIFINILAEILIGYKMSVEFNGVNLSFVLLHIKLQKK